MKRFYRLVFSIIGVWSGVL